MLENTTEAKEGLIELRPVSIKMDDKLVQSIFDWLWKHSWDEEAIHKAPGGYLVHKASIVETSSGYEFSDTQSGLIEVKLILDEQGIGIDMTLELVDSELKDKLGINNRVDAIYHIYVDKFRSYSLKRNLECALAQLHYQRQTMLGLEF